MDETQLREIAERKRALSELVTTQYEKGSNYTNLILAAGYAAFLTIWANSKSSLTEGQARISVALIGFSLLVFVTWEIIKMILTATNQHRHLRAIMAEPERFWAQLQEMHGAEQRLLARACKWWTIVLVLTVAPGLAGGIVLVWGLFTNGAFS